jgi:hypothetical protein
MTILNKQQIIDANDLPRETVSVPEWGGDVIVQGLSAAQAEALVKATKDDSQAFAINMLALSLVDESGVPLFDIDSVVALKAKNTNVLTRLVKVCTRINEFDAGEAEKNAAPDAAETSA